MLAVQKETSSSSDNPALLHLVCGKVAAGKSTLAKRLSQQTRSVLISEDTWLSRLYPNEIQVLADYARCAGRLRAAMAEHIESLLDAGISVVLDFPANTVGTRRWARDILDKTGTPHQLHFLDVSDEVCKARLRARNALAEHPFQTSDAEFEQITSYFVAPSEEEGFNVIRHE